MNEYVLEISDEKNNCYFYLWIEGHGKKDWKIRKVGKSSIKGEALFAQGGRFDMTKQNYISFRIEKRKIEEEPEQEKRDD